MSSLRRLFLTALSLSTTFAAPAPLHDLSGLFVPTPASCSDLLSRTDLSSSSILAFGRLCSVAKFDVGPKVKTVEAVVGTERVMKSSRIRRDLRSITTPTSSQDTIILYNTLCSTVNLASPDQTLLSMAIGRFCASAPRPASADVLGSTVDATFCHAVVSKEAVKALGTQAVVGLVKMCAEAGVVGKANV